MRKAQSISINTIIIAAIALIVLVVIIAIFGTRAGVFGTETQKCTTLGGSCFDSCLNEDGNSNTPPKGTLYSIVPGTDCEKRDPMQYCCRELISAPEK